MAMEQAVEPVDLAPVEREPPAPAVDEMVEPLDAERTANRVPEIIPGHRPDGTSQDHDPKIDMPLAGLDPGKPHDQL